MGRSGIGASLTAVQIVNKVELSNSVDFDIVGGSEPEFGDDDSSDMLF